MSGVATAVVAGSVITGQMNKDAAEAAADQKPEFAEILEPNIRRQLDRTQNTNVASFEGDRVADFTGQQQQGLSMTDALAGRLGAQGLTAGTGFQDFASGDRIGKNPFLEQAITGMRQSANQDLQRNQLPALRNNAIAAGGIGGTRQGLAEGVVTSDLNQQLINRESGMRQDQFNNDQNQQLQALIQQGNILSGQTAGQDLRLRTGALEQGQNQAEIGGEREAFNEQNLDQFNRDQELLRILTGGPSGTPPAPMVTNPLAAGLGAGLATSQLFPQQSGPTSVQGGPGTFSNQTPGFNPASTAPQFTFG